jgi:hypothetical protein
MHLSWEKVGVIAGVVAAIAAVLTLMQPSATPVSPIPVPVPMPTAQPPHSPEPVKCSVHVICPAEYCPYIRDDRDEYKAGIYEKGCQRYATESGAVFLLYKPKGVSPGCLLQRTYPSGFNCSDLK